MTRRRVEGQHTGESIESVPSAGCPDSAQPYSTVTPQVHFFQTAESYIALAQIWHEGSWIWGWGEVSCLKSVWEHNGGDGLIFKQVPRDPSDAMAQCARIASEQALNKLAEQSQKQSDPAAPQENSRKNGHDWTAFWKAVKDMGLDLQEVVQLAGGLMPKQWLEWYPDHDLDDLLDMLRWKLEYRLSLHPAISLMEPS